jgi:hypothetical protein
VLQQWFQLHHIGPREIESIIGALHASFPYISAWFYGGQGVLLTTLEPQHVQPVATLVALSYLRRRSRDDAVTQRTLNLFFPVNCWMPMRYIACRRPAPVHQYGLETAGSSSRPRATSVSDVDWMAANRKNLAAVADVASSRW